MAVILGEAIWGLPVSMTHGLVLPALARFIGGGPQSVLLLGRGDFDVAAIFSSILELCIAGIAALVLSYWSRPRVVRVRVRTVKKAPIGTKTSSASISATGMLSILAAPATPAQATAPPVPVGPQAVATTTPAVPPIPPTASQTMSPIGQTAASAKPVASSKPVAPAKPQKSKEVYYNLVGEPIYPTEDDN